MVAFGRMHLLIIVYFSTDIIMFDLVRKSYVIHVEVLVHLLSYIFNYDSFKWTPLMLLHFKMLKPIISSTAHH